MNFDQRLKFLADRRNPRTTIAEMLQPPIVENYTRLGQPSSVKYAVGAMSPVSDTYTQKSIDEGKRVADNLQQSLHSEGIYSAYEFQGSVPLNIHIRGVSDVDVLVLHGIHTYATPNVKQYSGSSDQRPMVEIMKEFRRLSETKLANSFHAAKVDTSNAKSICLSEGSLQRKVDIVPSQWHDTIDYQRNPRLRDREVRIYDKLNHCLIGNWPFLHMGVINDRDTIYRGNLKKVCRLLRTLQADSSDAQKAIMKPLKGYDIASISYHQAALLSAPAYFDLQLVANTRDYLMDLCTNEVYRGGLVTPDMSRSVFDTTEKFSALQTLTVEVINLTNEMHKQLAPTQPETYNANSLRDSEVIY